jgi:Domain of unknown function (DUF4148)
MIKHRAPGLAMVLLASTGIASNASAQERIRADVRQELIQAEDNGLRFVTDASYPDVAPSLVPQVARLQRQGEGGMGATCRVRAHPLRLHLGAGSTRVMSPPRPASVLSASARCTSATDATPQRTDRSIAAAMQIASSGAHARWTAHRPSVPAIERQTPGSDAAVATRFF